MRQQLRVRNGAVALIKAVAQLLCSRRFVIVIIALIVGVCVASVLIPQQTSEAYAEWSETNPLATGFAEWSGLLNAFRSSVFLVLTALLGVSLATSLFSRLKDLVVSQPNAGGTSTIIARRRLVGSLLFHAGLFGLLVAGAVSTLTRAEGNILLTEGQILSVNEPQIHSTFPPRPGRGLAEPFEIRLDRFHPVHEGRWGTPDYASDVTVIENGCEVRRATIRVNQPLSHRGVTLYQQIHGFSPLIVLRDEKGNARFGSWVSLNSDLESDPVRYSDEFQIPGTGLSVEAELFPDSYMIGDRLASRSADPKNPALLVTVRDQSKTLYEGPVRMGEPVEVMSGILLSLEGVRYWSGFDTVRDSGSRALFLCAWLAVAGLCLRFAPKRIFRQREAGAR